MNIVVECFVIELNIGKKKNWSNRLSALSVIVFWTLILQTLRNFLKNLFYTVVLQLVGLTNRPRFKKCMYFKKTLISHECNPSQRLYCSVRDLVIMTSSLLCYSTRLHRNMDYPLLSPSVRENLTGFGIFF